MDIAGKVFIVTGGASGLGEGGAGIDADATVAWGRAVPGGRLVLPARAGWRRYLHVVEGRFEVQGQALQPGDALVLHDAALALSLHSPAGGELLGFELPGVDMPAAPSSGRP